MSDDEVGHVLHEATDELNEELLGFERALQDLKLGTPVSIPLYEESAESPGPPQRETLEFVKRGKTFILGIGRSGPYMDEGDFTPLCSCSRSTRLAAVGRLGVLHAKLLQAYRDECNRVETAIKKVQQAIKKVKGQS